MRELKRGEKADLSMVTDVEGKTVKVVHTVKPDEEHQSRYELTWTFNFENVTDQEMLELATRPLRINKQRDWRAATDRMTAKIWDNQIFMVRAMLDAGRKAADPIAGLKKKVEEGKVSNDQIEAMIEFLKASKE